MDRSTSIVLGIIALVLACVCCLAMCIVTSAVVIAVAAAPTSYSVTLAPYQTPTPISLLSTPAAPSTSVTGGIATATPVPTLSGQANATQQPLNTSTPSILLGRGPTPTPFTNGDAADVPTDTLLSLEQAVVPINDLLELAERLGGAGEIPATLEAPARWYVVGDQRSFWVSNLDSNDSFETEATLQYVTEHAYFWIEDGVRYNNSELQALAEDFENNIYPTNREFFGSEWSPGVDSDPHVYILYTTNMGWDIAGYFSTSDEYLPEAHEYSNTAEMFFLSADNVDLDETFTYGVLAHEFQHMIHWYQDRNETSWLNEGFSELAALLNGYYDSGFDWEYARDPDMQLNDWPEDDTTPHYGASFLFVTYFLERFGEEATQALVANQNNGMASVNEVLVDFNAVDPQTGQTITANDLFLDWVITNYLQDDRVGDGRFAYGGYGYDGPPSIDATDDFSTCPLSTQARDVSQYGADFIRFTCPGDYTLHFEGSVKTGVLAEDPHSGSYYFWSNKGDESDMTLTRSFDFSAQSGPLTLNYWTWYDIEDGWDFLYLVASTDDGASWEILNTPSGTDEDPYGNGYGWGYSGRSGGWIQESVDISRFAGQNVQLRFEYVTDAAVNGEGLLLDDVSVPEIGYSSDFENDNGGWEAAGWVRIQNVLPQEFHLALITMGTDTTVQYITLDPDVSADIPISITGDVDEVVLVVTGTTQFTRQKAAYRFEVMP